MDLPFDGAISAYYKDKAPAHVRDAIASSHKHDILSEGYPYETRMPNKQYEEELLELQIELAKMQSWARKSGARVICIFEGRDAAGKGGTIKRFREHLNPRNGRVVALGTPNERERGEWYFQRYIRNLPTRGEIVFFDRSWYNRAVVEHVFGFCTPEEREKFFVQVPALEKALVDEGIYFFKFWLNVGRAEQLRRFLDREQNPLKQWKLSDIDVEGLKKWDEYSNAIQEMFARTHTTYAPWTVVLSDDKRRARLAAMRHVLSVIDYDLKSARAIGPSDGKICGRPDIWHA